jgi:hypothetical protein
MKHSLIVEIWQRLPELTRVACLELVISHIRQKREHEAKFVTDVPEAQAGFLGGLAWVERELCEEVNYLNGFPGAQSKLEDYNAEKSI